MTKFDGRISYRVLSEDDQERLRKAAAGSGMKENEFARAALLDVLHDRDIDTIRRRLTELEQTVSDIHEEVGEQNEKFDGLKNEVGDLKEEVIGLRGAIANAFEFLINPPKEKYTEDELNAWIDEHIRGGDAA